jgi:hypothetical protein
VSSPSLDSLREIRSPYADHCCCCWYPFRSALRILCQSMQKPQISESLKCSDGYRIVDQSGGDRLWRGSELHSLAIAATPRERHKQRVKRQPVAWCCYCCGSSSSSVRQQQQPDVKRRIWRIGSNSKCYSRDVAASRTRRCVVRQSVESAL